MDKANYKVIEFTMEITIRCKCDSDVYLNSNWPSSATCYCGRKYAIIPEESVYYDPWAWNDKKEKWINLDTE